MYKRIKSLQKNLYLGISYHDLNTGPYSVSIANGDSVGTEFMWGSLNPKTGIPTFSFDKGVGNPDPETCARDMRLFHREQFPLFYCELAYDETVILAVTGAAK